jgi:hypothetical protein
MSDLIRQDSYPRVFFDEPVAIWVQGTEEAISGRALNLSCSGIYICCAELLPESTAVHLEFDLPDGNAVAADALVVRSIDPTCPTEPAGMALLFQTLLQGSGERIESFIQNRMQPATGERVRLQLGDVAFPIAARAQSLWGNVLSVDAELPFLRLGSTVNLEFPEGVAGAEGGSIRWVSIHIPPSTGVPRLNIGIEMDSPPTGRLFDEEEIDPICNHAFAEHSRDADQTLRAERRMAAS